MAVKYIVSDETVIEKEERGGYGSTGYRYVRAIRFPGEEDFHILSIYEGGEGDCLKKARESSEPIPFLEGEDIGKDENGSWMGCHTGSSPEWWLSRYTSVTVFWCHGSKGTRYEKIVTRRWPL